MFGNVFIGVDGSSHGRDAIALAVVLAAPAARLTLVHVQAGATPGGVGPSDRYAADPTYYAAGRDESQQLLEAEREAMGVTAAELVTVPGPAVGPALHALAEQRGADLLVVGACKHRLAGRILIGDDTRASVSGATCPVGIAPTAYATIAAPPATIGVGYDFSSENPAALETARALAARHGSQLVALDTPPAEAAGELAEFADRVDLLVLASPSRELLRRAVFGSASVRLARHAHHPMLLMPHVPVEHARSESLDGTQQGEGAVLST
jgi:nucleotide-binding universal stress UspA family protein